VQISRRAVLLAAVLSVAGCTKHAKPTVPVKPVNPDAAALVTAQDIERQLLASYHHKIRHASAHQRPVLEVERAIHAAHLEALHGRATSGTVASIVPDLDSALRSSAATLRGLSLAAVEGADASLFASIAASHETSAQ
jgi:hypothetical protein